MGLPNVEELINNHDAKEGSGTDTAPETNTPDSAPETKAASDILELDKIEKFKFEGQEWSPKDLKNAYLRQQDYTQKTQALAEERKYYDNLQTDLATLRSNPALVDQFKSIYPEKFHGYVDMILAKDEQAKEQGQPQTQQNQPSVPPELMDRINRIEQSFFSKEVEAIEATLSSYDSKFSAKYPMANVNDVYAKAQMLNGKGEKLTEETWDKLWKSSNDSDKARFDQFYKSQIKEQKQAAAKAKDVQTGGGIPGQAPQNLKLKDVRNAMLKNMGSG